MATIYFLKFPLTPARAGAEFHTLTLAKHFIASGHRVELISSDEKLLALFATQKIKHQKLIIGHEPTSKLALLAWPFTYLLAKTRLKKFVETTPPGSIFFMQSLTEKIILTPIVAHLPQASKTFWIEHKVPGHWLTLNPLRYWYKKYARNITLVTVSNFSKAEFMKLGISECNIKVIYPGVISVNDHKSLDTVPFRIGLLSRLDPEKGVYQFLEKLLPYLRRHKNSEIQIAGEGQQEAEIKTLINDYNLYKQVKVLGFLNPPLVEKFFKNISVFVYPTLAQEAFGIAVVEAMSHGIPVLASCHGALPEIITHEENGFLFNPDDTKKLIKYLELVETSPTLYSLVSQRALRRSKDFARTTMLHAFDKLINSKESP